MNRGVAAVAFAGAMSLASALAWAGVCYVNSTDTCCNVILNGPGTEPCGSTTCVDVILDGTQTINYVREGSPGNKTTIVQDTQMPCKWENRVCNNGVCKQGTTQTVFCTPSRIVPPLTPCP